MAETLGPYSLDKRIGAGGMADVFLARGPRGVCVIKRPHAHLCANPDFVRMFLDEASILASLHHPNIAEIFDLGQVNGVYYLAMEYVPGFDLMTISLEHERQGELMAPELCARIVADVAGALHSAHDAKHPKTGQPLNLIHRDVTPHNVLLSTTGVVKLIDFGVARAATATHRTQAGLVKGKYPYMAPEQITGQEIDRRVDVYALGLVLYELLTNTRAIAGNTEVEQIDNARAARIRPIEQLRPNLPMPLRQIIASCVHPDREGRYPTAQALQEDLEKYLRFVGQPIGQEDLLRLFRVVAAEVAHLEPGTPPQLSPAEAQHTWGGARTEREMPSDPAANPEDVALGVAPTAPSMRITVPPPALQPGSLSPTLPENNLKATPLPPIAPVPPLAQSMALLPDREKRKVKAAVAAELGTEGELDTIPAPTGGMGRWVVLGGLALVVVIAAVLLLRQGGETTAAAPDAGVPVVAVVEDAGVEDDLPGDAGAALVEAPPVDAGEAVDDRAAVVGVTSDIPMVITSGGHTFGTSTRKTSVQLQLAPGKHVIEASNQQLFCQKQVDIELRPGDSEAIEFKNSTGTLSIRVQPVADFYVNGRKLPGGPNSLKDAVLCAGLYSVKVGYAGAKSKSRQVEISAGNTIVADFGVLEPSQ